MKGISVYEKLVLALTAAFVVGCVALFCFGRGGQDYTVTVTNRAPDSAALTQTVQEDGTPDSLMPGEKIDLNTAPALELARLPGIGGSRAEAIVAYREANGPFETVDELLLVDGIGAVTLEKLREYACV